ncbi:MAG: sensor histidine kinase [Pseudomonadota bacterium]
MPIFDLAGGADEGGPRTIRTYVAALAITAAAILLQIALWRVSYPFPLLFYLPAIGLAALSGGAGPGVLAAVVSAVAIFHFAWPGPHLGAQGSAVVPPFLVYAIVAAAIILAVRTLRKELMRLRTQQAQTMAQLSLEKERLNALQHRMTTNMQAVASLLTLQKMKLRSDPGSAARVLDDARQRVVELSRINRRLSERAADGQGIRQYLQLLCADFQSAALSHEILCTTAGDVDIKDPDKLLALSVLIGEAIGNALKHGFRDNQLGTVVVNLRRTAPARCQLTVADNGRGLPPHIDPAVAGTSGFLIMQAMAVQLGGKVEASPSEQGTTLIVNFQV